MDHLWYKLLWESVMTYKLSVVGNISILPTKALKPVDKNNK